MRDTRPFHRTILRTILAGIAVLFFGLAFTELSYSAEKRKLVPVTLMLNFIPGSQHAAFAYGVEKGFYADEGIDLTFINGMGASVAVKTIAQNKARFAWAASDAVATAISNDSAPVKMIGTYFVINQFGIAFRIDSQISSPKEIKGKKIALMKLGSASLMFPMYLEAIGLKESDVTEVVVPKEFPGPLGDGKVDGRVIGTGELAALRGLVKGKLGFFSYSDVLPIPGEGISVNTKYMKTEEDRDLNCRMIRATTRSFKAAISEPEKAAAAVPKIFHQPDGGDNVEVYKEGWSRAVPLVQARQGLGNPIGFTYQGDWERTLDLLKKHHVIKIIKPIDQYFTNEYMKCASQAP